MSILSAQQARALGDIMRDHVGPDDPYVSLAAADRELPPAYSVCLVPRIGDANQRRRIFHMKVNGDTTEVESVREATDDAGNGRD